MQTHEFVNSDPSQFDSNCLICEGKDRDSIHHPENVDAALRSLLGDRYRAEWDKERERQ